MDQSQSEGFYVTLPSNASAGLFPNNTASCYTTDLAKPIELNGQWMVGLCETMYPHTWYNLPQDSGYIEMAHIDDEQTIYSSKFTRGGWYNRPKDLLEEIVPVLRKHDPAADATFNNTSRRIDFKGHGQHRIRVPAPLSYMLGLKANVWWTLSNRPGTYPCDLKSGVYNLFVYTDIIQYQAVGDSYSPLLGTVKVSGDFGDMINVRTNPIHYKPVSKNYIKSIRIEIKTDYNQCVNFIYGKSIIKLHFRPVKSQNPQ